MARRASAAVWVDRLGGCSYRDVSSGGGCEGFGDDGGVVAVFAGDGFAERVVVVAFVDALLPHAAAGCDGAGAAAVGGCAFGGGVGFVFGDGVDADDAFGDLDEV